MPLLASLLASSLSVGIAQATGDVGYRDHHFSGIGTQVTGAKPESKLWWNDGIWWGVMWDEVLRANYVYRLDLGSQSWTNTGARLDARGGSRSDVLWDGTRLYVASHQYSNVGAAHTSGARIYRLSYAPATDAYTLDPGFPVTINAAATEALVMDKDSTGRLWATWVQDSQVYVTHSTTGDGVWAAPFVLPTNRSTGLTSDDISAVVAFDGDKIGVMWSHQVDSAMYFAEHRDGAPVEQWEVTRAAIQGPNTADDHINLKTLQSAPGGRVYAAVKTSHTTSSAPLVMLLVREPATGDWTSYRYGRVQDHHTRPIVLLDETNQKIHMFATSGEAGGTIYMKSSPMEPIAFPDGIGTAFIQDATSPDMNDATSTKQVVNAATGLVVLASDDTTDHYWHNYLALGSPPPPPPPPLTADFSADPLSGTAPLTVAFSDRSTGNPVSWQWDLGDGSTSTAQQPSHTYDAPGSYGVTLTVTDAAGGTNTKTVADYISVTAPPPPPSAITLTPAADAYVRSGTPTTNYGTKAGLSASANATNTYRSYLTFTVTEASRAVIGARLRLFVTGTSTDSGNVYLTSSAWDERAITWENAPVLPASALAPAVAASSTTWIEFTLPAEVFAAGNGTYGLAISMTNTKASRVSFSSREGTAPPELVLELAP